MNLDWPDTPGLVTEKAMIGTGVALALAATSFTISATRTLRIVAGARLGRNLNPVIVTPEEKSDRSS